MISGVILRMETHYLTRTNLAQIFLLKRDPKHFLRDNDLVRDLGLSKDGAELLGSRLKNKNLLTRRTSFSWYRHREMEFTQFLFKEGNLIFRNDVQGLKKCFDIEYDPSK
ncbi:hypothetical protein AVEN_94424-1 [Araneus ventricosus]|uniref:Uncharacterized protein n=1 Tax=Araneus ventricosus TaxID=182803 RepID=A0A4Y2J2T4_ARAVE|nr:hypothetical protein AVEN_94424-1 [Araneus ventricosus]